MNYIRKITLILFCIYFLPGCYLNPFLKKYLFPISGSDLEKVLPAVAISGSSSSSSNAVSITSLTTTNNSGYYKQDSEILIKAEFASTVKIVGTPKFQLNNNGIASYSSGDGTNSLVFSYLVQNGEDTAVLDVADKTKLSLTNGQIQLSSGAMATSFTLSSGGFSNSQTIIAIDTTSPTISKIDSITTNGIYGSGQTISIQVSFSEPVFVTGTPTLTLETGASDAIVNYTSTSGSVLTFVYTIANGEDSGDLDVVSSSSFSLNGATILDSAGNSAVTTLPAPGATNSLGQNRNLIVATLVPTTSFALASSNGAESSLSPTMTVNLSSFSASAISVDYAVTGGTATGSGTDYTLASGTLTFASGVISQNISLSVVDDALNEVNETVIVTLSNPSNATLGATFVHTYTINDDDAPPTIAINDVSIGEGNSGSATLTFAVTLSSVSGATVTVDYATADSSALAGSDYTGIGTTTLTFTPGVTTQNVNVTILGDNDYETNETFFVNLSNVVNSTISDSQGIGTVTNDDVIPTVSYSAASSSGAESVTSVNIPVTLSALSYQTVTVDYAVTGGTATGSGTDYTLASGTLTYTTGVSSQNIAVTINSDAMNEANETIIVTISNPTNSTLGGTTVHTYTINDDDPLPTVSFAVAASNSGDESSTTRTVSVNLSAVSGQTVTVVATDGGGTATSGTDYTAIGSPLTLTFNPGVTTQTVSIPVLQDLLFETGGETIILTLGTPGNSTLGGTTVHTFTITEDDFPITAALTLDCNGNGYIDHYKMTFGANVVDSTFPGYIANSLGTVTPEWQVAAYSNVRLDHGTSLSCGAEVDAANDNILYIAFTESGGYDTGAKPDLTTTVNLALGGAASTTVAQIFTGTATEADGAKPIIISITPTNGSSSILVNSTVTGVFSEAMNTGTFTAANFIVTGSGGVAGTVSTVNATTTLFTPSANLAYSQAHTVNISSMADINGNTMTAFASTFTTGTKNKVTGTITGATANTQITLTVNATPNNFSGTSNYTTTNILGIGDTYGLAVTSQPAGQYCTIVDSVANPTGGTFSGSTDLTVNVNCVNGYLNGNGLVANPVSSVGTHLYQGNVSTIAGVTGSGSSNGTGAGASFSSPSGVAFNGTDFYVADYTNHTIRKITLGGVVTTFAGVAGATGNTDGVGVASFNNPRGVATDGTYLYVTEFTGHRIKRVLISTGYVETIAGDNTSVSPSGADATGIGTAARFNTPSGVLVENNILYIAERGNNKIKKMDLATKSVTMLSSGAPLNNPEQVTLVGGYLYLANLGGNNIVRADKTSGAILVFAGDSASSSGQADAIGTSARFFGPTGITADQKSLYVGDYFNHTIRRVDITTQRVTTLVGNGASSQVDGVGIGASIVNTSYMTTDGKNFYFTSFHSLRKFTNNALINYYPLNGVTYDYSGSSNLTPTGSPTVTTGRFGEANGAYSFTSGTYLSSAAPATTNTTNVTLAVWAKWSGANTGLEQFILQNGSASNGYGILLLPGMSNKLTILAQGVASGVNCQFTMPSGVWTHVAAVSPQNGVWKMYVNGKQICTDFLGTPNVPTSSVSVGGLPSYNQYFNGSITDARFYTRVLNDGEINELAQDAIQAQVGGSYSTGATGLIANFHLNNGSNFSSGPITDLSLAGTTAGSVTGKDGDSNGARNLLGTSGNFLITNTTTGLPTAASPKTICAWANPKQLPPNVGLPGNTYVVANYGSASANSTIGIQLVNSGGVDQVGFLGYGAGDILTNYKTPLNTWTHFCAVYDGANASFYANGKQLIPPTLKALSTGSSFFTIGGQSPDTEHFPGKIQEVRIYNNALNAIQIRQLATQVPVGLVARYDFQGDANDASGFGANGTVNASVALTSDRIGNPNSAYRFTGGTITTLPVTSLTSATFTFWARFLVSSIGSVNSEIITMDGKVIKYNSADFLHFLNGTSTRSLNKLTSGAWNHFAVTKSGAVGTVYMNGVDITNVSGNLSDLNSAGLTFGSFNVATDLDDVQIYNRVLSLAEIRALSGFHPMQTTAYAASNLKLQLQADSLSYLANNASISSWNDDSGNGFNVSQGTGADQPTFLTSGINGKPAVNLSGSGNTNLNRGCETTLLSNSNTIFGVMNQSNTAGGFRGIFHNGNKLIYFNGSAAEQLSLFETVVDNQKVGSANNFITLLNPNPNMMFSINYNGGSGTISKNGTNVTSFTSGVSSYSCASNPLFVFGKPNWPGDVFNGYFGDFLYFDSALSGSDQSIVECYLSSKYGIPVTYTCP